jgi:group I intron endonuclease
MNREFKIYVATCLANGKVYVGQTSAKYLIHRISAHVMRKDYDGFFQRSIRKYGRDCFIWQVVATTLTKEDADNMERAWIVLLRSRDREYGYNLTAGGGGSLGVKHSEETKIKRSESMKKSWIETKRTIPNNFTHAGRRHSEQTKLLLSAISRAQTRKAKAICSVPSCGKDAHSHKLCSAHLHRMIRHGDPLRGNPPGVRGPLPGAWHHTEEAKRKIKETKQKLNATSADHQLTVVSGKEIPT